MKPGLSDHLLSALVAGGLAAVLFGAGLPAHLQHAHVANHEKAALLAVAGTLRGVPVVPGSAESETIGYADVKEGCAARASVELSTNMSPSTVLSLFAGHGLPHLGAELVVHHRIRIETVRTFGLNPLDWSCWN